MVYNAIGIILGEKKYINLKLTFQVISHKKCGCPEG